MKLTTAALVALAVSPPAHAVFIDLGNGAVYDTVQDVTWTQDMRHYLVDLSPAPRLSGLVGQVVSDLGGGSHTVDASDIYQASFFQIGGTWWGATAWAQTLEFAGAQDWRLPSVAEVGAVLQDPSFSAYFTRGPRTSDTTLFWTSTEVSATQVVQGQALFGSPRFAQFTVPKSLDQGGSFIQVMWAVHDGNITAVPEPSAWASAFAAGAVLLLLRRRAKD